MFLLKKRTLIIILAASSFSLSALIFLLLNLPEEPDQAEIDLYAKAYSAYENGDFELCISITSALLKGNSSFYQAALLKSKAEFFSGSYTESESTLKNILRKKETFYEAEIWKIRSLIQLGKTDQAEQACLELHSRSPEDPRLLSIMGRLSSLNGDYRKAIEYHKRAACFEEEAALNRIELAKLYLTLLNTDLAAENLERAIGFLNPDSPLQTAAKEILLKIGESK